MITAPHNNPAPKTGLAGPANARNKYLAFRLGQQHYAISILRVREILLLVDIVQVPQMPSYVRGIIHVRGKVVPVIDLRLKFELAEADLHDRTCIGTVQVTLPSGSTALMGFILDSADEVVTLPPEAIEPAPYFGGKLTPEFVVGVAKVRNSIRVILDVDRIMTADVVEDVNARAMTAGAPLPSSASQPSSGQESAASSGSGSPDLPPPPPQPVSPVI
ncbi:MAG: chemotaxis protein CheW [Candidatus Methylacidiphilales bacterium]|nr:chemotaxis protein CheW [Candidatus Methylacidiphilales bacterium]